jgi:shikimate kinase
MLPLMGGENIILIGMPGVGKSTCGVLVAKRTQRRFTDTDLLIQAADGRALQEIIDADGLDAFCRIEQDCLLCLDCRRYVIATGGSAIYSQAAMAHLKRMGMLVHMRLPLEALVQRVTDLRTRGLVMPKGQTLTDLYHQRMPLYERWADVAVDCQGLTLEQTADRVAAAAGVPSHG